MHDRKQSSEGCRRQTVLQWLAASMIVVAFSGPALADKGDTIELYRLQHKSWELLHHGGMDELIREGQDNIEAFQRLKQREQEAKIQPPRDRPAESLPADCRANSAPTGPFETALELTAQVGGGHCWARGR